MGGPGRPIWFAGELDDPWVAAIADALPRDAVRWDCPDALPESWESAGPAPRTVVLHRGHLTAADAQSLTRLRARCEVPPRVVLCVGPHARYVDVDRWSRAVDAILPEATADAVVLRHATPPDRRPDRAAGPRSRLVVVSGVHDIRMALGDSCRAGGYAVEAVRDWSEAPAGVPAVWDVPVLEPDWPASIGDRARSTPVVAVIGFADRATVAAAWEVGVAACLDSMADGEDLLAVLDRVTASPVRADPPHEIPPAPRQRAPARTPGVVDRGPRS
ncbi:hypothetical protein TA3x_001311 [Tundrisphaera sp. TA3]|uniref:hypothetical protein n=1 Tax=Tundrisphaera sp. TA3 TaxID=3435775 RepID=UPI003EBC8A19